MRLSASKVRFGFALILGLVLGLALVGAVRAQSGTQTSAITDDQVNEVAHQLYCPVCENTPLDVCPTQACAQWRELIRQKLSEGWSTQQIKDYFAQQYGVRVLGTPPATGLTVVLYALPYVAILAGAIVLYRVLKSLWKPQAAQSGQPAAPDSTPEPAADEYIKRLEDELRKR